MLQESPMKLNTCDFTDRRNLRRIVRADLFEAGHNSPKLWRDPRMMCWFRQNLARQPCSESILTCVQPKYHQSFRGRVA